MQIEWVYREYTLNFSSENYWKTATLLIQRSEDNAKWILGKYHVRMKYVQQQASILVIPTLQIQHQCLLVLQQEAEYKLKVRY
jgi:hypothetical protein